MAIVTAFFINPLTQLRNGLLRINEAFNASNTPITQRLVDIDSTKIKDTENRICTICMTDNVQLAHLDAPSSLANRNVTHDQQSTQNESKYTHGMCVDCFVRFATESTVNCPTCRGPIGSVNGLCIPHYKKKIEEEKQSLPKKNLKAAIDADNHELVTELLNNGDISSITLDEMLTYVLTGEAAKTRHGKDDMGLVSLLLRSGFPTDRTVNEIFRGAAYTGNLPLLTIIENFILTAGERNWSITTEDFFKAAFIQAAKGGQPEVIIQLLSSMDQRVRKDVLAPALNEAAMEGHQVVINLLAQYIIDPSLYTAAAQKALYAGQYAIYYKLNQMARDAKLNIERERKFLENDFKAAIDAGNFEQVDQLCIKATRQILDENLFDKIIVYAASGGGSNNPEERHEKDRRMVCLLLYYRGKNYISSKTLLSEVFEQALKTGNKRLVEVLIESRGTVVLDFIKKFLLVAVRNGDLALLNKILDYTKLLVLDNNDTNPNLNVQMKIAFLNVAFIEAAREGHTAIMRRLIEAKSFGFQGVYREHPILLEIAMVPAMDAAAYEGHQEVVDLLTQMGTPSNNTRTMIEAIKGRTERLALNALSLLSYAWPILV